MSLNNNELRREEASIPKPMKAISSRFTGPNSLQLKLSIARYKNVVYWNIIL